MNDIKNIIPTDLTNFSEQAYLNYSMYVIMDRALPRIEDGLKPVQRRILYAMNDLSLHHGAKYKKSARTIGDVLGKYHPHGDSACYEAMVYMAQSFSYRYPLVDGQGNWGSQDDPKSFAAMRYTEAKLQAFTANLLAEIKQGTTEFGPNFDGTIKEPLILPAQVPNILLNGATGIAVGMATDILPHNLGEIVEATKLLMDKPKTTTEEIMDIIPAPDFPTGALITSGKEDIRKIYETGHGSVKLRARHHIENKNEIVFTELPYKSQGEKVIEQIADLMNKKKLTMIEDIRDESDHENPVRIVVVIKKNNKLPLDSIVSFLCSKTDLESSKKANFNMIGVNGKPEVKGIKTILTEWISYRQETVRKKLNFRLDKINARLHLIEGLLIAFLNIDEVIAIIRESDTPKESLIERFNLSEIQANYILETKLRQLARLEEVQLNEEKEDLLDESEMIQLTLSSEARLNTVIKKGMTKIVKEFGDDRRSELAVIANVAEISEEDLAPSEPVTVILSKKGWIRSGKGHSINPETLTYKAGDNFLLSVKTESNKESVLFDNNGRSYSIQNGGLPSAKSLGDPLSTMIQPAPSTLFVGMFPANDKGNKVVASKDGYGFICPGEEFYTRQKKGKVILNCDTGRALPLTTSVDCDMIAVLTKQGHLLSFEIGTLAELKKGKGNKLITLGPDDEVVSVLPYKNGSAVQVIGSKKSERWTSAKIEPFVFPRGRKGKKVPKTFGTMKTLVSVE